MSQDVNVVALIKGSERYVFLYDDTSMEDVLKVLGRYAEDPALSFTWYDAAVLGQKMRCQRAQERRDRSALPPNRR